MRRIGAAVALVAVTASCAHAPPPATNLAAARVALARARSSPVSGYAYVELREAELALRAAENQERAEPGSELADEAAYLARRKADRARLSAIYAADLDTLEGVREKTSRLRENVARLKEARAERLLAASRETAQRREERAEQDRELEHASFGTVTRSAGKIVWSFPAGEVFIPGYPLLRKLSSPKVEAIATILRAGPPGQIVIDVSEDIGAPGVDRNTLARHRAERLREALEAEGIRPEILNADGHSGPTAKVNVVIDEGDPAGTTSSEKPPPPVSPPNK